MMMTFNADDSDDELLQELDNTTVPFCKSPIISRSRPQCRKLLQPVATIPETPDDIASPPSEVTAVTAVTASNFAAEAGSPQEGILAEQEATLPFTFCSALEPEWSTDLKPEASVFIDENSNATYCSDIDNNDTQTTEPATLLETRNSLQDEGTPIGLFDSATTNDSQAEGNLTTETDFMNETINTQLSENSSQNLMNLKSSKNSFEHPNGTCSQPQSVKKPSVLNNWRKGRKGQGKRRKTAPKNLATEPDTPPDSGSLVSFDSPPFYSSLPTENKRHLSNQNLLTSTQDPSSQNNSFRRQAKCLVKQVRAIRKAVDHWVVTEEGLGDPVETRKIVESIKREAQALNREADGPVKIELEHVLQACEYINLQLQYVPYHSTKAENSLDICRSKRKCEDLTFYRQQEEQIDDLPSLKEMLASTAIRPGHCNLTLNIGDEVVEKGSLDSKGHIYTRRGKVYLSAEAWYRESMSRKTIVTRHEAFKNILYRGVPLLFFCKINSPTKTSDRLPKRKSSGRDENVEKEFMDTENQEMKISNEQQEIPNNVGQMNEKLTSNTTFPASSTDTYFSAMSESHNNDDATQKEDRSKELRDDMKNESSNSDLANATTFLTNLQRKGKERQLTGVQKYNSWLGEEQTPDVPIIPEVQKTDNTSVQDPNITLPVKQQPLGNTEPLDKIKSSVTKEEAIIQSRMDSLDNEVSPVRFYHEPLAMNPKICGELPEESGLSEKTLASNKWHERLREWKTNPNSQPRQSRRLKSTYSPKHHTNESGVTLLRTLSEKVRILEENFTELKRSTDEIKSTGSRQLVDTVSCQQCQGSVKKSCDNSSSKKNKERPKVSTPRCVVDKSYNLAFNSQPEPSTSHSQPRFHSAEKMHGNKLETVKRNLGSWFSSSSRIGQKLQGNRLLNQENNVDKSIKK